MGDKSHDYIIADKEVIPPDISPRLNVTSFFTAAPVVSASVASVVDATELIEPVLSV